MSTWMTWHSATLTWQDEVMKDLRKIAWLNTALLTYSFDCYSMLIVRPISNLAEKQTYDYSIKIDAIET